MLRSQIASSAAINSSLTTELHATKADRGKDINYLNYLHRISKSDLDEKSRQIQRLKEENERMETGKLCLIVFLRSSRYPLESFLGLVKSFQEAFRQHVPKEGKLYSETEMEAFCEEHSPVLFSLLEKAITSDYSLQMDSERRATLRQSRVVGELHRLHGVSRQPGILKNK